VQNWQGWIRRGSTIDLAAHSARVRWTLANLSHTYIHTYIYDIVEINRSWDTIWDNIKIANKEILGYYELNKHRTWFIEECLKLLEQRKQAKLWWMQDAKKMIGCYLNSIRCETSRHENKWGIESIAPSFLTLAQVRSDEFHLQGKRSSSVKTGCVSSTVVCTGTDSSVS
jgi:hypothetical protein